MSSENLRVEFLADHHALVADVGEMRYREWGCNAEDAEGWIAVTNREAGRAELPITLVAIDEHGDALGAVALGEVDGELSEPERRGRSPWLLGLVVRRQSRLQGIGRLLVSELERIVASRGMAHVWVATGREAVDFYRRCGWVESETLALASTGIDTTILKKRVLSD